MGKEIITYCIDMQDHRHYGEFYLYDFECPISFNQHVRVHLLGLIAAYNMLGGAPT